MIHNLLSNLAHTETNKRRRIYNLSDYRDHRL